MTTNNEIDQLTINSIRMLAITAINNAKSGHPGIALGAAPIIYALFKDHLKFNPQNPHWFNRDRFVLSAGHGSALLYAMLLHAGYDYSIADLQKFRMLASKTPGHPEYNVALGIEMATGPLGQGLATSVGMALGESFLAAYYNQKGHEIIDHYSYVLCSDGDLQEGISQEALSLAGCWRLNKMIVLYDSNNVQLDSPCHFVNSENIELRMKALNWNYIAVQNGNDYQAISTAISAAKNSDKPTLIEIKTVIGFAASKQGTAAVHGAPLFDDIAVVKKNLNWTAADFVVPEIITKQFTLLKKQQGHALETAWKEKFSLYQQKYPSPAQEMTATLNGTFWKKFHKIDWQQLINRQEKIATRDVSGAILQLLSAAYPTLLGGSADLSNSTKAIVSSDYFAASNRLGRHIYFGVREAGMQAIVNGLTLHQGIIAFGATFLVFSDYLKPALRLAALMQIPALTIFSHDSIAVGEDGPTHQPIEQLTMLRTIPNYNVMRPCDTKETIGCYQVALSNTNHPNAIIVTRQTLPAIAGSKIAFVAKGAYIISSENNKQKLTLIIIATGSEVHLAIAVQKQLLTDGINARVVSMPSAFLFEKQPKKYQEAILPATIKKVAIEMGSGAFWYKYVGANGLVIAVNDYGLSANLVAVLNHYGFTPEKIYEKIKIFLESEYL